MRSCAFAQLEERLQLDTLLGISAALDSVGRGHRQGTVAVAQASGHGVHTGDLSTQLKAFLWLWLTVEGNKLPLLHDATNATYLSTLF